MSEIDDLKDEIESLRQELEYALGELRDAETGRDYFEQEMDRLGDKVTDLEMYEYDGDRIRELTRKLYISKLTLSSELFERELKSFFMDTIEKRL